MASAEVRQLKVTATELAPEAYLTPQSNLLLAEDPSRPNTAQVEQLIRSEGLNACATGQTDQGMLEEMGDTDPLETSQSSDRPNTALAEQLVSEEIAGRKSLTSGFGVGSVPLHALRESSMSPRGDYSP